MRSLAVVASGAVACADLSLIGDAMLPSNLPRTGHAAWFALALLAGVVPWSAAHAASSCTGAIQAGLLNALPSPVTVALQTSIDNSANPELARRFVAGLQQAGITVSPQGNMMLSMTVSIVPSASQLSGSGRVGGVYQGFSWYSGEQAPAAGQGPSIRSTNLSMSVTLTDNTKYTESWIATLECKVQTDNSGALAEYLGSVIGKSIGQNFDRKVI